MPKRNSKKQKQAPEWATPPMHFNCRCSMEALPIKEVEAAIYRHLHRALAVDCVVQTAMNS